MQVIKSLTKTIPLVMRKETQLTVEIVPDIHPSSPREWSNLGKILYKANRQYSLGDEEASQEEMERILKDTDNFIALPVYAYMHGSVSLSTKPYSCPWDSGQCGIIFVSKEAIRNEWKVKRISPKLMETVLSNLRGEIDTFSKYMNGEVFGYRTKDANGNEIDSCYGYYSVEEAEEAATENLPEEIAA